MGREIKRVPLDFDQPLNEVWPGFLNPYYQYHMTCNTCNGSGYSAHAEYYKNLWYGDVDFKPYQTGSKPLTPASPEVQRSVKAKINRNPSEFFGYEREARRMCSIYNSKWMYHLDQDDVNALFEAGRLSRVPCAGEQPTAAEVNQWAIVDSFGHDSINSSIVIKARCDRMHLAHDCATCKGSGEIWESKWHEWLADNWDYVEPPKGEGWQVWENVSEGSPISPVFKTEKETVDWLVEQGYDRKGAQAFVKQGYAPSFVLTGGQLKSGVDAAADLD